MQPVSHDEQNKMEAAINRSAAKHTPIQYVKPLPKTNEIGLVTLKIKKRAKD
jgi:hypothetical protein